MEQRERDESSSKLEEALRELTGAETTGKIEEYENEREGADVDSETACTDMRHAERMPAWRQEEDARKSKLSESRADVVNELNDDDWEQEELDEWDESEKSPRGMGRLAAVFRPSDDLLAAFFPAGSDFDPDFCIPRYFPLWAGKLPADGYVPPVCAVFLGIPA